MAYQLTSPIKIVEYDPNWPVLFEQEKQRILSLLGTVIIDLQHFGSTSIPGLAAKPILDLLGAVRTLDDIPSCTRPLRTLGYEDASVYLGGWIIEDRRLFCKAPTTKELTTCTWFNPVPKPGCRTCDFAIICVRIQKRWQSTPD